MNRPIAVAVIIPTLATRERAPYLLRAISSVVGQRRVIAAPVVVANGPSVDTELIGHLAARKDLRLLRLADADLPAALAAGRQRVDTDTFAELDDDDSMLPDALALRHQAMLRSPSCDAIVSNGFIRAVDGQFESIPDVEAVRRDPLRALMAANWLLPGALLLRSERFAATLLATLPRFLERTYLAAVLATRFRIEFLATPTVLHYTSHSFSIDRTRACCLGRAAAIRRLLELDLPVDVRRSVKIKASAAEHSATERHIADGEWPAAWLAHLRSVAGAGGPRFLPYTRHLFALATRRGRATATTNPGD